MRRLCSLSYGVSVTRTTGHTESPRAAQRQRSISRGPGRSQVRTRTYPEQSRTIGSRPLCTSVFPINPSIDCLGRKWWWSASNEDMHRFRTARVPTTKARIHRLTTHHSPPTTITSTGSTPSKTENRQLSLEHETLHILQGHPTCSRSRQHICISRRSINEAHTLVDVALQTGARTVEASEM